MPPADVRYSAEEQTLGDRISNCFNSPTLLFPTHILAHLQARKTLTQTKPAKELKSCLMTEKQLIFNYLMYGFCNTKQFPIFNIQNL